MLPPVCFPLQSNDSNTRLHKDTSVNYDQIHARNYDQIHTIDFGHCIRVSFPAIFLFGRLHIHVTIEMYSGVLWILPQLLTLI